MNNTKVGFVAFLGRPNVGKSSLINAIVGEKVSIVSPKPQTTRDKALGIYTDKDRQIIFVDTPGVHKPRTELSEQMVGAAYTAIRDADIAVVLIDSTKPITDTDKRLIRRSIKGTRPLIIVITKADLGGFDMIYPLITSVSGYMSEIGFGGDYEIVPTSARSKLNLDKLLELLTARLPVGELLYPEDEYTDKSTDYLIEETIREKALYLLQEEIPHGIKVDVIKSEYTDSMVSIFADIVLERKSHKSIVIGAGGSMLGKIGQNAREGIERLLGRKVYLKLFVKVREGWRG